MAGQKRHRSITLDEQNKKIKINKSHADVDIKAKRWVFLCQNELKNPRGVSQQRTII